MRKALNDSAMAAGLLLLLAGFAMVTFLGRNYVPCQGAVTAAVSPGLCQEASVLYCGGIIAGGAILLTAMISSARR